MFNIDVEYSSFLGDRASEIRSGVLANDQLAIEHYVGDSMDTQVHPPLWSFITLT